MQAVVSFLAAGTRARMHAFLGDQKGNATIEAALWLPFFIISLMAAGQVALIFFGQSVAFDAAQAATRSYSVGELFTEAEVRAKIASDLSSITSNASVEFIVANDLITTAVTVPAADFGGPLQFITAFANLNVRVYAQQRMEL